MKASKLIFWLVIVLAPRHSFSQPKTEIKEFSGSVIAVEPGWSLNYSQVSLSIDGEELMFYFNPHYAKVIIDNLKPRDKVTVKAKVRLGIEAVLKWNKQVREGKTKRGWRMPAGEIVSLQKGDSWIAIPEHQDSVRSEVQAPDSKIFLNIKVIDEYVVDGKRLALRFSDGIVGAGGFYLITSLPGMKGIQVGDVISFSGRRSETSPDFVYPIDGVKQVYYFGPLKKLTGTIKSFLYKQNHTCIGLVLQSATGEKRLSFPGPYAQRLQAIYDPDEEVTVYFSAFDWSDPLNPPELAAVVFRNQKIEFNEVGFFGGPDVKHEHKPAQIEGKITEIVRSDKGRIINIIVGNDCYVEVDGTLARQLEGKLSKGKICTIKGKERIKKEGEVYDKSYRIIQPDELTLDGTSFLVNQQ